MSANSSPETHRSHLRPWLKQLHHHHHSPHSPGEEEDTDDRSSTLSRGDLSSSSESTTERPLAATGHTRSFRERWDAYSKAKRSAHDALHGMTLRNLFIMASRKSVSVPQPRLRCCDLPFITEAAYYMRYAAAAYGWKVLNGLFYESFRERRKKSLGFTVGRDVNKKTLLQHVQEIQEDDVLYCRWKAELYSPSWFFVRDHYQKTIVIVVRGTLSSADSLVDLAAHPVPYSIDGVDGFVHEGMKISAERIVEEMVPLLKAAHTETPDYKLVVVGHSLGAGLAVLLTLMAYQRGAPDMTCYAFAVPTVLSDNLAVKAQQYNIHSFVLNADIVPRLSIKSLDRFINTCGKAEPEGEHWHPTMLPPGHLYLMWSPTRAVTDCELFLAHPADFDHIVSAKRKFRDHLPHNYDKALQHILQRMLAEHDGDLSVLQRLGLSPEGPATPTSLSLQDVEWL
eukprot:EG_transcript_8434